MKLTDRQIKNLKPKKNRYEIFEGNGFGIRISPSGKKSWIYVYHYQGRARRITFGHYPKISVAEAHALHGKTLADLEKGLDVAQKRVEDNKSDRLSPSVAKLAEEYLEKWAKPRKRSWKEDQRILNKDVTLVWGKRKANDIRRRDVVLLLDKILERGSPISANRTLAVVRRMFNFAIERDVLETTPCLRIKTPSKETKRDRVLSEGEIRIFWQGLENAKMSPLSKIALKFQLITAQRKGEVISAEWKEFDLKNGWWEIPAEKAKNGNLNRVPLSTLGINLLQQLQEISGNGSWLFPSPREGQHIAGMGIDHALKKNLSYFEAVEPFTPHDLRRTAASHIAALGTPRLVVSKLLNHVESSVTAIYDRHGYDTEKKAALDLWGKKLADIINH